MGTTVNYKSAPEKRAGTIDLVALVRRIWDGRKTILICTGIFIALGLVAAFTMKRTYSVSTIMVPQTNSKSSSGLSSLASLAGFDLGMAETDEVSPLVYPQIVNSVPFRLEIMHTPLHYQKSDTLISMFDYNYVANYEKTSVFSIIKRYTIGLPRLIIESLGSKSKNEMLTYYDDKDSNGTPKPVVISRDELDMLKVLDKVISLNLERKEGYITLTVKGTEPLQTADLAMKAQQLLQDEVTRFRIEKSQSELDYIQARYDEVKQENDRYQVMLATATDRSQNVTTSSAQIEKNRIQAKYNVSNAIFNEVAK